MSIKIALAGNPNSGKTTLFNALTGANQYVGNWPGVTVEKKSGKLKKHDDVEIMDLPGIYSLAPYTLEEVVARNYLIEEHPDAILNIVDGTNIERNLYLTTQLTEIGIPVVVAVNMMDIVRKNGDDIRFDELSQKLGCKIIDISALKGENISEAAELAIEAAKEKGHAPKQTFNEKVEQAISAISELALKDMPAEGKRWFAVKLFERDEKILEKIDLSADSKSKLEEIISAVEKEMDDVSESIITNERYNFITATLKGCYKKKNAGKMSTSDKIDKIVTNRILALPIFACIMFLIYAIAMGGWTVSIGTRGTDWANDGLFGDGYHLIGIGDAEYGDAVAPFEEAAGVVNTYEIEAKNAGVNLETTTDFVVPASEDAESIDFAAYQENVAFLEENEEPDPAAYGIWVPGIPALFDMVLTDSEGNPVVADWMYGLIKDGIVGGVGAVLGFVPQMLVLFLFLAMLEDCGYMARIAFVMDRLFRRFGLSGKSFIPMLVSTGCGVPGIMASRTIEQDRDRKLTIITTGFIPCGAKMPIIGLFAGAVFGNSAWIATSAFFIGIAAVVISGIMLKKFKAFAGDPAPFVMELPAYHWPTPGNVIRATWERGWSFIKRAGTIILLSAIILWFLMNYGFGAEGFGAVESIEKSMLASIGRAIAWIFYPLGWMGEMAWKAAVATVTGLIAKEEVVLTIASLYGMEAVDDVGTNIWLNVAADFGVITTYSFMIFQLLCAPCFAAMGAIKREMNNWKWTTFAISYMCVFAYVISMIVFQIGGLFTGEASFGIWTIVAIALLIGMIYLLVRPYKESKTLHIKEAQSSVKAAN